MKHLVDTTRLLLTVLVLSACGGAQTGHEAARPLPIIALRARAAASPNDAALARELAIAEMLWDGGEAARARPAIDHALELAPDDAALWFLSSTEHEQHGRMADAFDAELRAIEAARASESELGPAIAEVLVGYAGARENDVRDWRARIRPALEHLVAEPGAVGAPARLSAAWGLARLMRRAGEGEEATRTNARAGCVQEARVAGPFGPYPMLGFDRPVPAEGRGPMADRYDLSPARRGVATRSVDTNACGFDLGEGLEEDESGPGVWVVESRVSVTGGRHLLFVQTPNTFRVRIDGEQVAGVDRRRDAAPELVYLPIELGAGEHEIEVVLASRHPNPFLALALAKSEGGFDPTRGATPPERDDRLSQLVRVLIARRRGDPVGAREALLAMRATPTATLAIVQADVTLGDPFLPEEQREDRARRLLEHAAELDPDAWYPRYRAALAEQGARESFALLRETADRYPAIASLQLEVSRALLERGRTAEADALVARAREHVPTSCAVLEAELASLRRRGRSEQADARVDELLACDARSEARLALFTRQRRWDDVRAEIDRLAALVEPEDARSMRLDLAVALGDDDAARALRTEFAREQGRTYDEEFPFSRVDDLVAAGQRARALDALADSIAERPHQSGGLRRVRRALGGDDLLFRHRVDGPAAIREFEASGRRYEDAAQLLVLDYMIVRLHTDGSAEELVHQIYRVQSEEAIEELGQLSLPGYVLNLRVIKPDGRRVEPDAIEGLDHVELPGLAVGDYVEYEFVRWQPPTVNGGYRSSGWVFQNFSYPFDLSRIVLIAPPELPVVVEPRGPVPAPVETRDGSLRVWTWTVEESRPLRSEPDSAVSPERLPHLDFGVRADWSTYFDGIVDNIADQEPRDPAAQRLVREILRDFGSASLEARVRAISRWVLDNIEDGSGGAPLPVQVAARAGSRNRVLRYLLDLAGIDARIVLSRALGAREPGELARDDVYASALVMVRREGGEPFFTSVAERGIPFGYVGSSLRGQEAIVIEPGTPRVVVGAQGSRDLRDVRADVALGRDGSARVTIEERFSGAHAYFWRQQLEGVPRAELDQRFEQGYVVPLFGPARLVSLAIDGVEDTDAPLVLRYVADVPLLGRVEGPQQLIAPFFRSAMARNLASLPARETTERVLGNDLRVQMTVRAPGRGLPVSPPDRRLEGPHGASASWSSSTAGEVLTVTQEVHLPSMLVLPTEYPAFATFCRDVDRLEATEVRVPR